MGCGVCWGGCVECLEHLDITATTNSLHSIFPIDQSVRLLKTGNDITQHQVSMECWCVGVGVLSVWSI